MGARGHGLLGIISMYVCFFQWGMEFCRKRCLEYPMVRVNGVRNLFMFIKVLGLALAMPKHLLPLHLLSVSHCKLEIRPVVLVL